MKINIKGNFIYGCAKILCFVVNILELIEKIIKEMDRLFMFCLKLLLFFALFVVFCEPRIFANFIAWLRVATDQDIVNSIQFIFVFLMSLVGMYIFIWVLYIFLPTNITSITSDPYFFRWKVVKKDNSIKFIEKKYLFFETRKVDIFVLNDLSEIKIDDNEKIEKEGNFIFIIDKDTEEIKGKVLFDNIFEIHWKN